MAQQKQQKPKLSAVFVSQAADILGDTYKGMTGPEIARVMKAYAMDSTITIPHPTYPFQTVNKRTALHENLIAFKEEDQYRILLDLCGLPSLSFNAEAVKKLKLQLMTRYGHLGSEPLDHEVNDELVEQTLHWLGAFPSVLKVYKQALEKYDADYYVRNLLDDLRLALETLLRELFNNSKSLENQMSTLGAFVSAHGGSPELSNMFLKLVDYYCKYQNTYVKHNAAIKEEEIEFILEISSAFMKHLIRLAGSDMD